MSLYASVIIAESRSSHGHRTEQNLQTRGSVAEEENEGGGTIYCTRVDTERNKISNSVGAWRKCFGTAILGGHRT